MKRRSLLFVVSMCLMLGLVACGGGGGGSSDGGSSGGSGTSDPSTPAQGVLQIFNMGQASANDIKVTGPNGFSASITTLASTQRKELQNAPAGSYTVTYSYIGSDMYGRPSAPVQMQKTGSVLATTMRGSIGLTTGLPPTSR